MDGPTVNHDILGLKNDLGLMGCTYGRLSAEINWPITVQFTSYNL